MAATTSAPLVPQNGNQTSPTEPEFDEAALNASMARLQDLHIALRTLRQSIPTLIDTIAPSPTPTALYTSFSQAAASASTQIRDFSAALQDQPSQTAFELARKSKERDAETGVWCVEERSGWLDVGHGAQGGGVEVKTEGAVELDGDEEDDGDVNAVVDKYRSAHPTVKIEVFDDEGGEGVTLSLPAPAMLDFRIERRESGQEKKGWRVTSSMKGKSKQAIAEVVNARAKGRGLGHLLELLAAYQDFKSRSCDKCSRLVSKSGDLPLVRIEASARRQPEGERRWQAFHRACI